jgi:molecular chaperone GrpE (heat shock protein)
MESVRDKRWGEIRNPLLIELPKVVPEDLKPTFDTVLAPARDFYNLMTKLFLVPKLVKDELPRLSSDAEELMRLRELINLLTMAQNSNLVADRLNFRLEPWIVDHFLGFADLFLQRYQQAQMEKRQSQQDQLEPGLQIVRQVLKIADLEPVDVTPGVTHFDSNRHVGRSTACDMNLANGVIVGVIRNGFVRGGQKVIRQPEVIVNRVG